MTERWLPVVGFEGLYEVSDLGNVRSLDRRVLDTMGRSYTVRGRRLSGSSAAKRYRMVRLHAADHAVVPAYVHDMVAAAFLGPKPEGAKTLHRDDDPQNNARENLRYGTQFDNMADALSNGGMKVSDAHHRTKIPGDIVRLARLAKLPAKDAAKTFGCCERYARDIMKGEARAYD